MRTNEALCTTIDYLCAAAQACYETSENLASATDRIGCKISEFEAIQLQAVLARAYADTADIIDRLRKEQSAINEAVK